MTKDATLTRQIVVEGFVQGVGYRDFTRRAALKLNVSGWVRNRPDGTVEAVIRGAPAEVEALIAEMRRGPRGAGVTRLRVDNAGGAAGIEDGMFVIRATL
jgi:acylphosphatase